jgi:hypothetical protein
MAELRAQMERLVLDTEAAEARRRQLLCRRWRQRRQGAHRIPDVGELEEACRERDPEVVARLLIGCRDAVDQALERVAEASRRMVQGEEAKRRGGASFCARAPLR